MFNRRWLTSIELPNMTEDKILNKGIKNTLSAELYEFRNYLDVSSISKCTMDTKY